jgi:guanine deaminase
MDNYKKEFMDEAIRLSLENVKNGGGPFGAVIVRGGKIIAKGFNQVTQKNDPTCHAEVTAIREAAKKLNNFELSGCEIYSSCEPCPMCLGAIYWARIDKIYYANTKLDAKKIGFDDSFIYDEMETPIENRKIPTFRINHPHAIEAFDNWDKKEDKLEY